MADDDTQDELFGTLDLVIEDGRAQCRLCDIYVHGDSYGEILEKLAEHGEEAHTWNGPAAGWSE